MKKIALIVAVLAIILSQVACGNFNDSSPMGNGIIEYVEEHK